MKRALHLAAYVLVLVPVVVVVLEGAVRFGHLAPPLISHAGEFGPDPFLPYKYRPLSSITERSASGEFAIECRHNSLGFRDTEHSVEKPPGTFRIVALGDSFTYGVGAPFEDTYLMQLERLLNTRTAHDTRVEIIKLGLPRHYPEVENIALRSYGLQYSPDLVLVGVLPNDVIDTYLGLDALTVDASGFLLSRQARQLGRGGVWLYLHSALLRTILTRWVAYVSDRDWPIRSDDVYRDNGFHEPAWRKMESDLEEMQRLAQTHGAILVVVSIPQRGPANESRAYPDRRLARWSAQHGAVFVATLPALQQGDGKEPLYWERDGHCTPAGYTIIARAIFSELTQRNLVP